MRSETNKRTASGAYDAISLTTCERATLSEEGVLIFGQFDAELQETVKPTDDQPRFQLVATGRKVKVDFKHRNDDMSTGENITIVPKQDGGWTLVWWECTD